MANPTTPPENTTPTASTTTSLVNITKMIEQFKLPGVDMSALIAARKKDIEALTQVNRIAYESLQAMAQKQTEILKTTMEELQSAAQKMAAKPMESITHESRAGPADLAKGIQLHARAGGTHAQVPSGSTRRDQQARKAECRRTEGLGAVEKVSASCA